MATETQEAVGHGLADATGVAAHAPEASGGLPQLDFSTFANQIFWLMVALVAIYFILSRIALPRIGAVLSERHGTITSDIAAAEDLRVKAQEAEQAYEKALADARTQAHEIVAAAKGEIRAELDAATARADVRIAEKAAESEGRIAEIRANALSSVEEVSKDVAAELVAAMGSDSDAKTINAAVTARLKG